MSPSVANTAPAAVYTGKALVVEEANGPFHLVDLTHPAGVLKDDEVLVNFLAAGICHTDLGSYSGKIPAPYPCVLGHEGAGVVTAVGAGMDDSFAVGDHVLASFCSCGACGACHHDEPARCDAFVPINLGFMDKQFQPITAEYEGKDGKKQAHVKYFGQSSFGSVMPVTGRSLVRIPKDVAPPLACALACGFQTGFSSVLVKSSVPSATRSYDAFAKIAEHTGVKAVTDAAATLQSRTSAGKQSAQSAPTATLAHQTLLVNGIGAVGLGALIAGTMLGYGRVVACDIDAKRLSLAKQVGAHEVLNATQYADAEAFAAEVKKCSADGRGATLAVEASGAPVSLKNAVRSLAMGGKALIVGAPPPTAVLDVPFGDLLANLWSVEGVLMGNSEPTVTLPYLCALLQAGKLDVLKTLVKTYKPSEMMQAVKDATDGTTIKAVIDWTAE